MNRNITILSVLLLTLIGVGYLSNQTAQGEVFSSACTASTSAIVIGNQASTLVVSTTTNRAFARLQANDNATNTVMIGLRGAAAVSGQGPQIHGAVTLGATSTQDYLDFGLNTNFPYTGTITAKTDNGSTTLNITQCLYQ
jgi:hypothetical protein